MNRTEIAALGCAVAGLSFLALLPRHLFVDIHIAPCLDVHVEVRDNLTWRACDDEGPIEYIEPVELPPAPVMIPHDPTASPGRRV